MNNRSTPNGGTTFKGAGHESDGRPARVSIQADRDSGGLKRGGREADATALLHDHPQDRDEQEFAKLMMFIFESGRARSYQMKNLVEAATLQGMLQRFLPDVESESGPGDALVAMSKLCKRYVDRKLSNGLVLRRTVKVNSVEYRVECPGAETESQSTQEHQPATEAKPRLTNPIEDEFERRAGKGGGDRMSVATLPTRRPGKVLRATSTSTKFVLVNPPFQAINDEFAFLNRRRQAYGQAMEERDHLWLALLRRSGRLGVSARMLMRATFSFKVRTTCAGSLGVLTIWKGGEP